ncbi:ImmA/IrrE family metallo-endopeptidase [Jiangella muralis]|uniref:ImmA/IrrE family metallo-endopeptidase n=1 Tax=Jiangella muralis TaxID=702383 RepID=UPI00069FF691|nr:ImmA/IrrE family metallo-endopeptidase [Jiangella muralis]
MALRRGFKSEAEALAEEMRAELDLGNTKRLDPQILADHLEIPVWTLTDVSGRSSGSEDGRSVKEAILELQSQSSDAFSAMTVFRGPERVIVHNDRHDTGRQASNITHELAHGLLLHPASAAIDDRGCRNWAGDVEDEASYLGGALLIPGKGARWIARVGMSVAEAASRFGCSADMVRWRLNVSGAQRIAKAQGRV